MIPIYSTTVLYDIGVTAACFHEMGTVPLSSDCWNRCVNKGANSEAVYFKNVSCMLSGPGDLFMSHWSRRFLTEELSSFLKCIPAIVTEI